MRIDVASIDMVSEVNMVSGLATGPAAALTQMRNAPVPVPSAFGWRSPRPGPGIPLQARSLLWHTRPAGPGLYFEHTHGLLQCSGGNVLGTIWGRTGDWRRRSGWGGVSGTFAGFPRVSRGAGHHLPAAGWPAPAGPRTVARSHLLASRDPRSEQARPSQGPASRTQAHRRFPGVLALPRPQHPGRQVQQAGAAAPAGLLARKYKPASGRGLHCSHVRVDGFVLLRLASLS